MLPLRNAPSDFARAPITRWAEDETFYSLCSRQHVVLSSPTPSSTSAWLFGSPTASTAHDLPFNLAALNGVAAASWGSPRSIIFEHTILPFFLPFQSAHHEVEAMQVMEGQTLGSLKYKLGLLTGRFGAEHPLKACSQCMETDLATQGFTYWHLSHQYPGVLVCPTHREMLRESCYNRQWSGRFHWILPSERTLEPTKAPAPEPSQKALQQLATAVLDLVVCGHCRRFHPDVVRTLYKTALASAIEPTMDAFAHHCASLQPFPIFASLPTTPQQVPTFWAQLVRDRQSHSHPLKHLVAITWLFGSVSGFVEAYDRAVGHLEAQERPADHEEADCQCCKSLCTDRPNKTPQTRRPKVLKLPIRNDVLDRLCRGEPKNEICARFGITVSTVNKLLRSEPEVKRSWIEQSLTTNVEKHRSLWVAAAATQHSRTPHDIRALAPDIYAWLYRNDREWLLSRTRELPSGRLGNHSRVDWAKRDEDLLIQVSRTFSELGRVGRDGGVSRRALFLACPTLAGALEKYGRYPRTRAFVKSVVLT